MAGALARGLEAAIVAAFARWCWSSSGGSAAVSCSTAPSRWTEEVAIFLLMWVALLGAAVAFRQQRHLGVDYFVGRAAPVRPVAAGPRRPGADRRLRPGRDGLGGGVLVRETLASGQVTPATDLPMGYVYLAVPISGAFVLLFVARAGRRAARGRAGRRRRPKAAAGDRPPRRLPTPWRAPRRWMPSCSSC